MAMILQEKLFRLAFISPLFFFLISPTTLFANDPGRNASRPNNSADTFLVAAANEPQLLTKTPPKKYGEEPPGGYSPEEQPPVEEAVISGDILGRKSHHFHPFVSVTGIFSDNIYFTPDNEIDDFITIISPGFWLSIPETQQKLVDLDPAVETGYPILDVKTSTVSPGGYRRNRQNELTFNRYQLYFLYGLDIERYADHNEEDTEKHRAEAFFQYNLKGGLSFNFFDQFIKAYDARGTGLQPGLDEFSSNLFSSMIYYVVSEKFRFNIEYSNFALTYDEARNNARDRNDNSVDAAVFFRIKAKTAIFTEYKFIDITYDESGSFDNSQEHHLFEGLEWDMTGKSKGRFKVGYGWKDFEALQPNDSSFMLQLDGEHTFSSKRKMSFSATKKFNESAVSGTKYTDSYEANLRYKILFTEKTQFNFGFFYYRDQYEGATAGSSLVDRRDNIYKIAPSFQVRIKDWLTTDCAYVLSIRESNIGAFDYTNNSLYFRLLFTL